MGRKGLWSIAGIALLALLAWSSLRAPEHDRVATPASQTSGRHNTPPDTSLALPPQMESSASAQSAQQSYPAYLPDQAIDTLRLIARGGPYPHRQDDGVFQNREHKLPAQPRGYYREYTVETPDSRDRGARRIIAGGQPPTEFFYTDDHYRNFRRFTTAGHTP